MHVLGVPSRVAGNLAIILSGGGGLEKGLKMEDICMSSLLSSTLTTYFEQDHLAPIGGWTSQSPVPRAA